MTKNSRTPATIVADHSQGPESPSAVNKPPMPRWRNVVPVLSRLLGLDVPRRSVASSYVLLACAMGWLSSGNSQEPHRDLPPNAHFSAGEQGWTCNNGFRQVGGLCVTERDEVPSWSAFEVYDKQWRCRSGYRRSASLCVPDTAPAHASFVGNGDRWECDWGFQKVASHCEEIKPPPHAYLEASGHDWVCFPGFERRSDRCVPTPGTAPPGGTSTTPND